MKHKVSELDGALLDAAVAKVLGATIEDSKPWEAWDDGDAVRKVARMPDGSLLLPHVDDWAPSSDWWCGGHIIEFERITLMSWTPGEWEASMPELQGDGIKGPTPLIAAMRALVTSKAGNEIELP